MKRKPLGAYLVLVALLSGSFILGTKLMGERGYYLAGFYMLGPAAAAILTRLFFYEHGFKDAHLGLGRWKDYLKFWLMTIGIVLLSYVMYTLFRSISWDFSGHVFLRQLGEQMSASGRDINDLPVGLTPKVMLLLFVVGGLTLFNIPTVVYGFGEEFGWRGFMFPRLYMIRPWVGFVVGGLIWFAWHVPLLFIMPKASELTAWQQVLNAVVLAVGSVCGFIFFAYVYVRSGSIWVVSFSHAAFDNAARSLSYFAQVKNEVSANLGLAATMLIVVAALHFRGSLGVFRSCFESRTRQEEGFS